MQADVVLVNVQMTWKTNVNVTMLVLSSHFVFKAAILVALLEKDEIVSLLPQPEFSS